MPLWGPRSRPSSVRKCPLRLQAMSAQIGHVIADRGTKQISWLSCLAATWSSASAASARTKFLLCHALPQRGKHVRASWVWEAVGHRGLSPWRPSLGAQKQMSATPRVSAPGHNGPRAMPS